MNDFTNLDNPYLEYLLDAAPFVVPYFHTRAMTGVCYGWITDKFKDAAIIIGPQFGKSLVCDFLASYILSRDPRLHVFKGAYGISLVQRTISRERRTIQSEWWRQKFGFPLGDKCTSTELILDVPNQDARWSIYGAQLGGSISGHKMDFGVIDDYNKDESTAMSHRIQETLWENFTSTVVPRTRKLLIVGTSWHLNDLLQRSLRLARENKAARQWTVLTLPVRGPGSLEDTSTGEVIEIPYPSGTLCPELHPEEEINEIQATISSRQFEALYNGKPSTGGATIFPRDLWGVYKPTEAFPVQICQGWDFASGKAKSSNDFTVCVTVALLSNGRYAVIDRFKGKPDFPTQKQMVFVKWCEMHQRYGIPPNVFIEDASAGTQALQEIAAYNQIHDTLVKPIPVIPTHNKEIRAEAIASTQNNGLVDILENAPWREDFVTTLEQFPLAQHDDDLDAYVYAQAGFVRGQGFFKVPEPEPQVIEYDAMEPYTSSFREENAFDAGEGRFRYEHGQIEAYYAERMRRLGHR